MGRDTTGEVAGRARPGGPSRLAFVTPPAAGTAGQPLPEPLVFEVSDAYGNPVPGRSVAVSVTGGKVAPARAVTDSTGRVALKWTLGTKAGPATLAVKVPGSEVKASHTLTVKVKSRRAP